VRPADDWFFPRPRGLSDHDDVRESRMKGSLARCRSLTVSAIVFTLLLFLIDGSVVGQTTFPKSDEFDLDSSQRNKFGSRDADFGGAFSNSIEKTARSRGAAGVRKQPQPAASAATPQPEQKSSSTQKLVAGASVIFVLAIAFFAVGFRHHRKSQDARKSRRSRPNYVNLSGRPRRRARAPRSPTTNH